MCDDNVGIDDGDDITLCVVCRVNWTYNPDAICDECKFGMVHISPSPFVIF